MPAVLAQRQDALATLGREAFDLLIVGGGINGAGIARDAALRGLRTAVVEQSDFGSGTSSRSSKLIHGGLRYLEEGDVGLVLEAVRERERLRRLAPHLVRPQEFVYPCYRGVNVHPLKLAAGLWAYDILAGLWAVKRHKMLRTRTLLEHEPGLRREGLRGAGLYFDYRTDDARLVLETMLSAVDAGAVVLSYAKLVALVKEDGRIVGARVADRLGAGEVTVRARVVVNAAGPWVDKVSDLDAPGPVRLRLTKGVHVVVPRARIGHNAAIVLNAVVDRRVMFVIPWGEHSLVGTTDTDHVGGPDVAPEADAADVKYLLDTVNHYFPAAHLTPSDVVSAFAGLRPLVAPPPTAGLSPSAVSREEEVFVSPAGMVTIAGGKLTTYRLIAAKVVDRAIASLRAAGDRRPFGRSTTGTRPLPGGDGPPAELAARTAERNGHGLPATVVGHLAHRYGSRMSEVMGLVSRDRGLGEPIVPGLPDPRAEVVEAVEQEWALTLEDVLRRRTQVALRDAAGGGAVAEEVATLMAARLGWDLEQTRTAARAYVESVAAGRRRWA